MKIYRKGKVYIGWDKFEHGADFKLFGHTLLRKRDLFGKLHAEMAGVASELQQLKALNLAEVLNKQCASLAGGLHHEMSHIISELEKLKNINIPAAANHPEVFSKYKGCHAGRDVVVVGTGPTLDRYSPIPGAVHIGVNRAYMQPGLDLDYLVIQDRLKVPDESIVNYRSGQCRKFFGVHYLTTPYPEKMVEQCGAERYYFDAVSPQTPGKSFPLDLAHQPFLVFASTIFVAVELALWTHPRRIYVVGCDCSLNGYCRAAETGTEQMLLLDPMIEGWRKFRDFAQAFYPDVEIISINPVGLKGIFRDMSMQEGRLEDIPSAD